MKKKCDLSKLPFRLDRTRAESLVRQMTDGLRSAIVTGFFKPGDVLPTIHEWTRALDVSIRVPEGAIANLVKEGLVATRPRHGTSVLAGGGPLWRGHVLLVRPIGLGCYFADVQMRTTIERLSEAGYFVSSVSVRKRDRGGIDFSQLDFELKRNPGLVIVFGSQKPILRHISAAGVRFMDFAVDAPRMRGCVGHAGLSTRAAFLDFVAHCRRRGVRRVMVIAKHDVGDILSSLPFPSDMEIRIASVVAEHGPCRVENLERESCRFFDELFDKEGRAWLPDVIFAVDDYLATGALFSILAHGVSIPRDVGFVTVKNSGNGPTLAEKMTCVEHDPAAVGEETACAAVRFLETGEYSFSPSVAPKYIIGETF